MNVPIDVDLSFWLDLGAHHPYIVMWRLILVGGWIPIVFAISKGLKDLWLYWKWIVWSGTLNWVYLAIDVPRENDQSLKAMEGFLAIVAGTRRSLTKWEQWYHGMYNLKTSLEIVSIDGCVQYLIRVEKRYRANLESAIYAYFPDAEITEVEDYVTDYKSIHFPNDTHNLWGTEFVLVNDYPYAIRTFSEFEHSLTQTFLDPMADLLEVLSRLDQGEQLWLQLVVTPQPPGWGEKAKAIIKEKMGETYSPPETVLDKALKPIGWISQGVSIIINELTSTVPAESAKKEEDQWRMFRLSPGERKVFEEMQRKLSKHSFRVKFRMVYLAEKEIFQKGKGVASVIGAVSQFNVADANGFKPGPRSKTSADYFRVKARVANRQNRIMRYFASRNNFYGDDVTNMYLNTEELASIWHFPVMTVKAPSVEMISSRKVVPPSRLPYEGGRPIRETLPASKKAPIGLPVAESKSPVNISDVSELIATKREVKISDQKNGARVIKKPAPPSNLPTI